MNYKAMADAGSYRERPFETRSANAAAHRIRGKKRHMEDITNALTGDAPAEEPQGKRPRRLGGCSDEVTQANVYQ